MAKKQRVRKLHTVDLIMLFGFAVLFDLLGFIPLLGSFYLAIVRLIFWLKGLSTTLINAIFSGSFGVEMIPGISILPMCTVFIFIAYMVDKSQSGELGETA